ncbi:MAG: bifunctional [glutamate--ammonia ligase]-adenylyl-L-tyrosine phosphorylase/[glutamate--ammonia-ligase] adenylyltransferase [Desulfuromonadaceae bacterium]|nr:bifunctional [glutamate--ammonia ligase]-adenylyl-L-tyrosine phosphorylase/[glutamate--ammonia-ligase] adenylyltransferase [Desulfuromonadaceae bacterium]
MTDGNLRESLAAACRHRQLPLLAGSLKELGFREEEKSAVNLIAILEQLGMGILPDLVPAILATPDPDLCLNSLDRLCTAVPSDELLSVLAGPHGRDLLTVLGTSPFLTSILVTQKKLPGRTFQKEWLAAARTEGEMLRELDGRIADDISFEKLQKELRLFKKQEVLRIATRDLCGLGDLATVTGEISALAAASLQKAFQVCGNLLRRQYGAPTPEDNQNGAEAAFTILGMGKLGGRELNFSSDIDLMYFYSPVTGMTTGVTDASGQTSGVIPLHLYFVKLANLITKAISQPTADGFVFRVDLNLRPEGKSGDIAQSCESAEIYYESWGQSWERSALIKARPVAGSIPLGVRLLKKLHPFIFRRYLDFGMIEDLKLMKQKIDGNLERKKEGERNIKLGRGGIREIEFFIQTLQLIHAGKHPELRVRNSLQALRRLEQGKFITAEDHQNLRETYIFLRRVENRLQIFQEQQTHSLPVRAEELRTLARSCGFDDAQSFSVCLEEHRNRVEKIYRGLFFGSEEEQNQHLTEEAFFLLDCDADGDKTSQLLARKGFSVPAAAHKSLLILRDGPPHIWLTAKARRLLARIAPLFVQEILDSPDPETALRNTEDFFTSLRSQTAVFALLAENPKLVHLLVSLFSTSRLLSRFFIEDPAALDALASSAFASFHKERDTLAEELAAAIANCASYEEKLETLRRFRHEEFLRIAINDMQDQASQEEVSEQLSDLADVCLQQAAAIARDELMPRYGLPLCRTSHEENREAAFAVVALGRLGGRELTYHSPLDLIFIFDLDGETSPHPDADPKRFRPQTNQGYFSRLAQRIISILSLRTGLGQVFQIDSRQRPSGHQGPLVSSLSSFARYHQEGAEGWERQALTKARVVCGPDHLRQGIAAVIGDFVYGPPLPENFAAEVIRLREEMALKPGQTKESSIDLKSGRGGLLDVIFLSQYLQIRHGGNRPALRQTNTTSLLKALRDEEILGEEDYRKLSTGYHFLLRLENRLRLLHDRSIDALSDDPGYLTRLALRMGYVEAAGPPAETLMQDYLQATEAIRKIYRRFLAPPQSS